MVCVTNSLNDLIIITYIIIFITFQAKAVCILSHSKYTDIDSGSYRNNPSVSCPTGTKLVGCTGHSK